MFFLDLLVCSYLFINFAISEVYQLELRFNNLWPVPCSVSFMYFSDLEKNYRGACCICYNGMTYILTSSLGTHIFEFVNSVCASFKSGWFLAMPDSGFSIPLCLQFW